MSNKISVNTLTALCAIAPDNEILWNLSEDGRPLAFWELHDRHSKKRAFLSQMVGFPLTDDHQLPRAAVLCREYVLQQFPLFSEALNCSQLCWQHCMKIVEIVGPEISVEALPAGVYKPLAGCEEHQFRHCTSVEEVLELDKKLTSHGG